MLVKFLKNGRFALNPVYGPVIECSIGKETDLSTEDALNIASYGWAVAEVSDFEIDSDDTPALSTIGAPWNMPDWDERSKDAKSILEQYGKEHFGIDIDRRKSVKNIIKQIKKASV